MIAILRETQGSHNAKMDIEWIRNQLERPGYTQRGLAAAMGVDPSTVSKMLDGKRRLQLAEVPKVEAYFASAPAREAPEVTALFPADDQVGEKDLPVYASAEGGQGAMVITQDPIDYVKRPEPLLRVTRGFACYVVNDSMSPAYEHGDLILVHPALPARPMDDCLFTRPHLDGGLDALVKRLLRAYSDRWKVKQHNPNKEFDLRRDQWQNAMVIVGKYSRR